MSKNLSLTAIICGLGVLLGNLFAQDLTITQASFTESGSFQVRFAAETNGVYFRLLAAGSPIENYSLVGVWVPNSSSPLLTDVQPNGAARFYRVESLPLDATTDTDSDGMLDWYELAHFPALDVSAPADALADFDGDGRTNLSEFLAGSEIGIPERDIGITNVPSTLACGDGFTIAVQQNGSLWSWGRNELGQLGDGTRTERFSPVPISPYSDWIAVSACGSRSLALRKNGTLWMWGGATAGDTNQPLVPAQVAGEGNWSSIAAGPSHFLAIKTDGTLWSWGSNSALQLGYDGDSDFGAPRRIGDSTNWVSASAGGSHSVALRADGTVWTWGGAALGILGHSTNEWAVGNPTQLGRDSDWRKVVAGPQNSYALRRDGSVWTWGRPRFAGDAYPTGLRRLGRKLGWKHVIANNGFGDFDSRYEALALDEGGSLWVFNWTRSSEPDDQDKGTSLVSPMQWQSVAAGAKHIMALSTDGRLAGWGSHSRGDQRSRSHWAALGRGNPIGTSDPSQVGMATNWTSITAGEYHCAGIQADGSLWVWGVGELGLGSAGFAYNPFLQGQPAKLGNETDWSRVEAGDKHTAALKRDGSLWTWGSNSGGALGNGSTRFATSPTKIEAPGPFIDLAAGGNRTMAIMADGSLWACGQGTFGFGDGTSTDHLSLTKIGSVQNWSKIRIGGGHSMGIRSDGLLWGWGTVGVIGIGPSKGALSPVLVAPTSTWRDVALDGTFTLAIRSDSSLWAWGTGYYGQLGDGEYTVRFFPTKVGTDSDWETVAAGELHSLAIKQDGTLWTWGSNSDGQLGLGRSFSRTSASTPQLIGGTSNWKAIAAGEFHSAAIKTDGTLWTWGRHSEMQLGDLAPQEVVGGPIWGQSP